jgi:hypothetical protein
MISVLFRKKIGRIEILKPLLKAGKIILICGLVVYIPAATIAFISDAQINTDRYAAILLSAHAFSDHDHWAPVLAFIGSYPAWTLYFNSRDLKPDYFFSATSDDFMKVLQDDKYQSIVLVGHGSYSHWRATDMEVNIFAVQRLEGKFKKKTGEWFQLTCATRDFSDIQLGERVMKNKPTYAYDGEVGTLHLVTDALIPFWRIKAVTERRINKLN